MTDDDITDPTELHTRLTAWADANNDCVILSRVVFQFASYQAMLRLERLGGCESTRTGWLIRKAAVITDDNWHVCEYCYRAFPPDPQPILDDDGGEVCSDECARTRDCAQCGAGYMPATDRDVFCSDECRQWWDWTHEDPIGRYAWRHLTPN